MASSPQHLPTTAQHRGLSLCLAGLILFMGYRLWENPRSIPNAVPMPAIAPSNLTDRLDPNAATVDEIAAIPRIGKKRASAIVEYRTDFLKKNPGGIAFRHPSDLLDVKGIGPAMSEAIAPYLSLPKPTGDELAMQASLRVQRSK